MPGDGVTYLFIFLPLADRLMESESEILSKSNLVLDQLLGSIREYISALYNCAELVSLLDYYTALACYASKVNTGKNNRNLQLANCLMSEICSSTNLWNKNRNQEWTSPSSGLSQGCGPQQHG
jgi:hypothetical protein